MATITSTATVVSRTAARGEAIPADTGKGYAVCAHFRIEVDSAEERDIPVGDVITE